MTSGSNNTIGLDAPAGADAALAAQFTQRLQNRIGAHRYDMWFGQTCVAVDGKRVRLSTDSPFVARWIDTNFSDDLRHVAEEIVGERPEIDVRVDAGSGAPPAREDSVPGRGGVRPRHLTERHEPRAREVDAFPAARSRRRAGRSRQSWRRLEDFVVGESNRLAYTATCRLADDPDGKIVSPLFLHGPCGVGKTHLQQGACRRFAAVFGPAANVRYVTAEQFTNEYIAAVRAGTIEEFRARIRRLDLLAIDDVHFLSNKVRTQTEFLHTLDAINLAGSRVIVASDQHPRQIRQLSPALVSRLLSGMIVQIDPPDRAMRVELVRRLAEHRKLALSDSAVQALAARCGTSVRELEGAVTKLAALDGLRLSGYLGGSTISAMGDHDGGLGMSLVNQVVADQTWESSAPARFDDIVHVVCEHINVTRADLVGSGRHRRVVLGRGLVTYLARERTTMSYPEIAQSLGRRNHSMVYTADQRLRGQLERQETVTLAGDRAVPVHELVDQLFSALRRPAHR